MKKNGVLFCKRILILKFLFIPAIVFHSVATVAEEKKTISGHVRDISSGEELVGVSIYVAELQTGTSTNDYGFYSLTIPVGDHIIKYSMMGFKTKELNVSLTNDITKNIELSVEPIILDRIQINAEQEDEIMETGEAGAIRFRPENIKDIPVIFGEQDIMKTLQLMPGVKTVREGEAGFSVRGGGVDQNLVLLDEAVVYNPSHLLGFFSIFNPDVIKDVKLIKGTASAEYGGRLSSVLDIKTKEGNSRKFTGSWGLGLISSRLTLEAPIKKERGSFVLSGRRTYFDLFLRLSNDESTRNSVLYFYDVNLKSNYRIGNNDRVFLSGYYGRDVFSYNDEFGINWGNRTTTLRWNHIFNPKVFLNTSLIYSKHDYVVKIDQDNSTIDVNSLIEDIGVKQDYQYYVNPEHLLKFGFNTIRHLFMPGKRVSSNEAPSDRIEVSEKRALENAVYLSHEYDASARLRITYGLRYSGFAWYGPGYTYEYDGDGKPVDSTEYRSGELIKYYDGLEPRFNVSYVIDESSTTNFSYTRNKQYLHLLSTSASADLISIWLPSSNIVRPGSSDQITFGYFRKFSDNLYETSLEVYYKNQRNLVDYKNGANIFLNEFADAELIFGRGWSYGAELLIKKKHGKITGWIGYTLAKTERKFDDVDKGRAYPARYDRTHEVSIVAMRDISKKWTMSANWVYYTGNAVTFPSGKYEIDERTINLYSERNGYRMPAYHRLDIAFTYKGKRSSWNFSLYNAYGRRNAYMINFLKNDDDPAMTEAVRLSLFSFFPAITYNFQW